MQSFFGRTYSNMSSISECKNNGECVIDKKNRTSCKACRLRKCLLVGMSKSGSRYGRRSNWFKIHCLLQEQSNNNNQPNDAHTNAPYFGNGLYPSAFFNNHFLPPEKQLPSPPLVNSIYKKYNKKRRIDSEMKSNCSSEESLSSMGETEGDISRSPSALSFLRPPSSHQSPSPFSETDYLHSQKKLSAMVTLTPIPNSPVSSSSASNSFSSPPHFYIPHHTSSPPVTTFIHPVVQSLIPTGASATRPGLTPVNRHQVFLDNHSSSPLPILRTGGDLLLRSPALGGVAVEQDQPIDLSVKSQTLVPHGSLPTDAEALVGSESKLKRVKVEDDTRTYKDGVRNITSPLDLTRKRTAEVPQSG
uniref:Nuclear receptor domain-containing protein n=1 Tax=Timema douglasi TaxID=61478 RepID=A0A7R8VA77_TIMDO|nr:unnamed protein product [Timema douglasi]